MYDSSKVWIYLHFHFTLQTLNLTYSSYKILEKQMDQTCISTLALLRLFPVFTKFGTGLTSWPVAKGAIYVWFPKCTGHGVLPVLVYWLVLRNVFLSSYSRRTGVYPQQGLCHHHHHHQFINSNGDCWAINHIHKIVIIICDIFMFIKKRDSYSSKISLPFPNFPPCNKLYWSDSQTFADKLTISKLQTWRRRRRCHFRVRPTL